MCSASRLGAEMKTIIGSVVAAVGASACCLGPVVLSLVGAGALGATAARLEVYRPYFLGLTVMLLGAAFFFTYRPSRSNCGPDGCARSSRRTAKMVLWLVTVVVLLLVTFPYYVNYLL
jgi:mercuric ion transport protein